MYILSIQLTQQRAGVLAMLRNFYAMIFFLFMFGIGYGAYLSVDFAMVHLYINGPLLTVVARY